MNKQETLALWKEGPAAWNAWAEEMLDRPDKETEPWMREARAEFTTHEFSGRASFLGTIFPGPASFERCNFASDCEFSLACFHDQAQFSGAYFHGDAWFRRAQFLGQVSFHLCKFKRDALFEDANINNTVSFFKVCFSSSCLFNRAEVDFASFQAAQFRGETLFIDSRFRKQAIFDRSEFFQKVDFRRAQFGRSAVFSATFQQVANFEEAGFNGATSFRGSTFLNGASFQAAKSEGTFDMAGATFCKVPNFIQATFSEAPRLDNVVIQRRGRVPGQDGVRRDDIDDDLPARWRALKRLALQGHDHIREQEYFAEEVKALRDNPDKPLPNPLNWFKRNAHGLRQPVWPGGGRYWLGRFYQCLSNFGRSAARPVFWWTVLYSGSAYFYLRQHFAASAETGTAYVSGVGEWLWSHAVQHFLRLAGSSESHSDAALLPICCINGEGNPGWDALGLSLNKALPLSGIGSPEKLNQIYACLYGIHGGGRGALPERFTPVIPDLVYYLGMVQTLFSLVLIFLFLLALRNHFRIR